MQLVLKNTGSTAGFIAWLKGFKDINPTILIEVDLTSEKFIAKCFPDSRCIVKYSEISFEAAGYAVEELTDNDGNSMLTQKKSLSATYKNTFTGDNRIKVGVYSILPKVIDVATMYTDNIDHTIAFTFDISNNVKYVGAEKPVKQYQTEKIIFKSKSLTMTINCSVLSEFFRFLSDEVLDKMLQMGGEIKLTVTPETISNLNRISQLFSSEKNRSAIKFYTKQENDGNWALYAFDEVNKSYDYLLGYYNDDQTNMSETSIVVLRENFINATKGITNEMQLIISAAVSNRIIVTSESTRIVIASHQS